MSAAEPQASDLIERIRRLEDIEAIRRVMGDYVLAADDRHGYSVNVERTVALFAKDGIWDGSPRYGRHEGREAVRNYLETGRAGIDWSLHHLSNPTIEVAPGGKSARGRWYLIEMARMLDPATQRLDMVWLGGVYDAEFIREDGAWKFKLLRFGCQSIVGPDGNWILAPAPTDGK